MSSNYEELKDRVKLYCEIREEAVSYNDCRNCNHEKMPHPCWASYWLLHQIQEKIKEELWGDAPSMIDMLRLTVGRFLSW